MDEKKFFADVKGVGDMVNKHGDYGTYHVRCGLRTGEYVHSETVRKGTFVGVSNGRTARQQADAFVKACQTQLVPKESKQQKGQKK